MIKDTMRHSLSQKSLYGSGLAGNEGAPMSNYESLNASHYAYVMFEPTRYEKILQPYINAFGPTLRIPVTPATLEITREAAHSEVQGIMFGGILERNAPGLRHFAVTSFIPGTSRDPGQNDYRWQNYYPWKEDLGDGRTKVTNGTRKDDNLVATQSGWVSFVNLIMDRRIILKFHLVKAPFDRHRNECFLVCIRSFRYSHNPHDDLNYTIEFVEWREPKIRIGDEQIITAEEPEEKPPKAPSGGPILLVMHQVGGVRTEVLHSGTQLLLSAHGGYPIVCENAGFKSAVENDPTVGEFSKFLNEEMTKKVKEHDNTDNVDVRKTKLTSVSLGIQPSGMSSANIVGQRVLSLSCMKKADYAKFKEVIGKSDYISKHVVNTGIIVKDLERNGAKQAVKKAHAIIRAVVNEIALTRAREFIKVIKFLTPPPIKLYDGGQLTGYGESGLEKDYKYDGSIQAYPISGSKDKDPDAGGFTQNAAYDTNNKSWNVNRSGTHKLIIDETGYVRYDDLVRRVSKFQIPLVDWQFGANYTIKNMMWTILQGSFQEGYAVGFACDVEVKLTKAYKEDAKALFSTIDTAGNRMYKGQRFTVLDSHLRKPTKDELELNRKFGTYNKDLKR